MAFLSLLIAVVALVLVVWLGVRTRALLAQKPSVDAVPEDVLGLRQEVAALRAEVKGSFKHLSVVRYDAFADMGGHLSWSVALLDDAGDGVVLTSIHGRSDARSYAKTVSGWKAEVQLSPEEEQAIASARHPQA